MEIIVAIQCHSSCRRVVRRGSRRQVARRGYRSHGQIRIGVGQRALSTRPLPHCRGCRQRIGWRVIRRGSNRRWWWVHHWLYISNGGDDG